MQEGSLGIDDPPQESSVHVSQTKTKKDFRRKKVKVLLKFKQISKLRMKRNKTVIPTLMLGEG